MGALSCFAQFSRAILLIFNLIFWLSGCGLIGFGIWILVDKDIVKLFDSIRYFDGIPLDVLAFTFLGVGLFIFIFGFVGCCGAIRKSRCLLGMYIFLLVLIMCLEIGVGILCAIFKTKIEQEFDSGVTSSIKEDYNVKPGVNITWDYVHRKFKCCGANSPSDYRGSQFTLTTKEGCIASIEEWLRANLLIIIGVACGVACLQLFGFIFATCLCLTIKNDSYYRDRDDELIEEIE